MEFKFPTLLPNLMPRPSARTKSKFSQAKKLIFALKRVKNDFLTVDKILSMDKKLFSIHFTSKCVLLQLRTKFFVQDKNILSVTKIILLGQKDKAFIPMPFWEKEQEI